MRTLIWMTLMLAGMAAATWADCTSPAGKEGEQVYASAQKVMVYCNGTDWMAMGSASTGGGSVSGNIAVANISATANVSVTTNLSVGGTVLAGWERVTGTNTANCTAGKQVIGGGCLASAGYCTDSASWISAPYGYPSSATAYTCGCPASGGVAGGTITAYAICARVN